MPIIILFVLLLSACNANLQVPEPSTSPNTTKDHAPIGPAPAFFRPQVPKNEPLSRYGNPESYNVNGKTYQVMTSASGYKTRGIASWYATKFHKRRTSSGENYDMYALTAAHKTLPLPTYVRVKNLANGREAILKVNDRGPFHANRVLDLSYGSALKLGVLPHGTANVEIEALTIKGAHVAHYYLQAGAFSRKQLALALQQKLAKFTTSPVFVEQYQHSYIVKVGPFANKSMSTQLKSKLLKQGINGAFTVLS